MTFVNTPFRQQISLISYTLSNAYSLSRRRSYYGRPSVFVNFSNDEHYQTMKWAALPKNA